MKVLTQERKIQIAQDIVDKVKGHFSKNSMAMKHEFELWEEQLEDYAQELCILALSHKSSKPIDEKGFKSWLFVAAKNHTKNWLRRASGCRHAGDDIPLARDINSNETLADKRAANVQFLTDGYIESLERGGSSMDIWGVERGLNPESVMMADAVVTKIEGTLVLSRYFEGLNNRKLLPVGKKRRSLAENELKGLINSFSEGSFSDEEIGAFVGEEICLWKGGYEVAKHM